MALGDFTAWHAKQGGFRKIFRTIGRRSAQQPGRVGIVRTDVPPSKGERPSGLRFRLTSKNHRNGTMVPLKCEMQFGKRQIGITTRRMWMPTTAQRQFLDFITVEAIQNRGG
jgi:hypothetical protein